MNLHLNQDQSYSYKDRTIFNAENSDLTIYFADKNHTESGGAKLTSRHSKSFCLVQVPTHINFAVEAVLGTLEGIAEPTINVAGNGIARFPAYMTQNNINAFIYNTIKKIHAKKPIKMIRSGGQTGADWGGIIAGVALEIETVATFPLHYRQRDKFGKDFTNNTEQLCDRIRSDLDKISLVLL